MAPGLLADDRVGAPRRSKHGHDGVLGVDVHLRREVAAALVEFRRRPAGRCPDHGRARFRRVDRDGRVRLRGDGG